MKAQSTISPPFVQDLGDGSYLENSNILQITRENEITGEMEPYYEYDSEKKFYPIIPEKVAAYRVKFVAGQYGLSAAIDAFIDALPADMKELAHAAWNYGTDILRSSIMLSEFCNATGTDTEIIDSIFIDAFNLNI